MTAVSRMRPPFFSGPAVTVRYGIRPRNVDCFDYLAPARVVGHNCPCKGTFGNRVLTALVQMGPGFTCGRLLLAVLLQSVRCG